MDQTFVKRLKQALLEDDVAAVRELKASGCPPPSKDAVHLACWTGAIEALSFFVNEWSVQPESEFMETAAFRNNLKIVRLLLKHGTKPTLDTMSSAISHNNEMMIALLFHHDAMAVISRDDIHKIVKNNRSRIKMTTTMLLVCAGVFKKRA